MRVYAWWTEREFCEQLRSPSSSLPILLMWFLDLNIKDEPVHPPTCTKNRERLLEVDAERALLMKVVRALMSVAVSGPPWGTRSVRGLRRSRHPGSGAYRSTSQRNKFAVRSRLAHFSRPVRTELRTILWILLEGSPRVPVDGSARRTHSSCSPSSCPALWRLRMNC